MGLVVGQQAGLNESSADRNGGGGAAAVATAAAVASVAVFAEFVLRFARAVGLVIALQFNSQQIHRDRAVIFLVSEIPTFDSGPVRIHQRVLRRPVAFLVKVIHVQIDIQLTDPVKVVIFLIAGGILAQIFPEVHFPVPKANFFNPSFQSPDFPDFLADNRHFEFFHYLDQPSGRLFLHLQQFYRFCKVFNGLIIGTHLLQGFANIVISLCQGLVIFVHLSFPSFLEKVFFIASAFGHSVLFLVNFVFEFDAVMLFFTMAYCGARII